MTAAASGSSGITVADDDDIDFGTGDFTIHWEGALDDYTPAQYARFFEKRQDASNFCDAGLVDPSGTIRVRATMGGVSVFSCTSTAAIGLTDRQNAKISVVVVREAASTAGSASFYVNGVQLGSSVAISAAATASISNTGSARISGTFTERLASTTRAFYLYNRALSAAEVLSLCNVGVAAADAAATQTPVYASDFSVGVDGWTGTSMTVAGNIDGIDGVDNVLRSTCSSTGTGRRIAKTVALTLGLEYSIEIAVYFPVANVSADSFLITNQSGTILATGVSQSNVPEGAWYTYYFEFIAAVAATGIRIYTGTSASTSATTTNGDIMYISAFNLKRIGNTLKLEPSGLPTSDTTWTDSSGNGLDGTLPAAGATKVSIRK
jgi:hypothetical protein